MPDVKKLITGFLIIAAAASSSAFMLSGFGIKEAPAKLPLTQAGALSLDDQNAFVPTQADIVEALVNGDATTTRALNDPHNLTANFTDAFLNGLAVQNPNGFQTDTSGNLQLQSLNAKTLAAQIKKNQNLNKVPIPNWDADAAAQKLNIVKTTSTGAYNNAISAAFNKNIIQSGIQNIVSQTDLDQSNVAALTSPLQNTVTDVAKAPTPAELANFQKSLVKMLVYAKNMTGLVQVAATDPVKAAIIDQAQQAKYIAAAQDFSNEFQKASAKGLISFQIPAGHNQSPVVAFLQTYLGIPRAHAIFGLGDITFDIHNFITMIKEEIETTILQILKNTLVSFIQKRVLTWIQGSGAPKFVQQFGQQLVQAGQSKAMAAAADLLPKYKYTCPNIGNLLGPSIANLGAVTSPAKQVPQCNLPPVSVSQLTHFYDNFSFSGANVVPGGSWGLYAQVLSPNNNYYGALMQSQDYINQQSANAEQETQTKQVANQGFSGQEVCRDGSDPNGTSPGCVDPSGLPGFPYPDGSCPAGYTANTVPNGGRCADGSAPITTTPGQTTKQVTDEALGGAIKLTVSANSIAGVLASVATSLLNTVVEAGVTAAVNAGTKGLTSVVLGATGSTNGGASPTAPAQPTGGPSLPATQCYLDVQCSAGGGTVCSPYTFADTFSFSATGGDGITYDWSVGQATDPAGDSVDMNVIPSTQSGPLFSPRFELASTTLDFFASLSQASTSQAVNSLFPITIPVTVTGSDNISDTCNVDINPAKSQ